MRRLFQEYQSGEELRMVLHDVYGILQITYDRILLPFWIDFTIASWEKYVTARNTNSVYAKALSASPYLLDSLW